MDTDNIVVLFSYLNTYFLWRISESHFNVNYLITNEHCWDRCWGCRNKSDTVLALKSLIGLAENADKF